jgi:hypothetical protein
LKGDGLSDATVVMAARFAHAIGDVSIFRVSRCPRPAEHSRLNVIKLDTHSWQKMSTNKVINLLFTTRAVLILAVASTLSTYVYSSFLDNRSISAVLSSPKTNLLSPLDGEVTRGADLSITSRIEQGQHVFEVSVPVPNGSSDARHLGVAFKGQLPASAQDDSMERRLDVVAPSGGKVLGVFAKPGATVRKGDRLLSYSNCNDFFVVARVSTRIYNKLSKEGAARIAMVKISGQSYPAHVVSLSPALDSDYGLYPSTPTVPPAQSYPSQEGAYAVLSIGGDVSTLIERCPIGLAATAYF